MVFSPSVIAHADGELGLHPMQAALRAAAEQDGLASAHYGFQEYEHALPLFKDVLALRRKGSGPQHPETLTELVAAEPGGSEIEGLNMGTGTNAATLAAGAESHRQADSRASTNAALPCLSPRSHSRSVTANFMR